MDIINFCNKYNISLTPQQLRAAEKINGNTLIVATPGSGKTTLLVTRLGYMIEVMGIPPSSILTITYTTAATKDMRLRFSKLFPHLVPPDFRTVNSFAVKVNNEFAAVKGRKVPTLIKDEDRKRLIYELYKKHSDEFPSDSVISDIETLIGCVKNTDPDIIPSDLEDELYFDKIYPEYRERLKAKGYMDFDDQLIFACQILSRYKDILDTFSEKYRYICVDEAQDTSKIQHSIIELMAKACGNLFMVGDDDQSIYGFRGAYPTAMLQFAKTYDNASVLYIEENFRCEKTITDTAQRFISQNTMRYQKNMFANRGKGEGITGYEVNSREGQYDFLLSVAKNHTVQTAVLYRNNDSVIPLIDLLIRNNIPYSIREKTGTFFTSRQINDFTDFVEFSENQRNGELFLRLFYKMRFMITRQTAEAIVKESIINDKDILLTAAESELLSDNLRKKARILHRELCSLKEDNARMGVERIRFSLEYEKYMALKGQGSDRLYILSCLAKNEATPKALVKRLEILKDSMAGGGSGSDFILSTIHSAKGLEYDSVYILDCIDGILPAENDRMTAKDKEKTEEDRRLFYVAVTRAKNSLSLFKIKNGCSSPFVDFVLKNESPAPPERKKPDIPPQSVTEFVPGTEIEHKVYGGGRVTIVKGDIATIEFDSGEKRSFSLTVSINNNQLKIKNRRN